LRRERVHLFRPLRRSELDSDLPADRERLLVQQSSIGWALYEYAAIPGTIACGWMSDSVFKGRRAPATILFMALTLVAVVVYWLNARPLWIDYARSSRSAS
jgi:sugar phosphate permease